MAEEKRQRGRGYSIPEFSRRVDWTHRRTTKAIQNGELACIELGGQRRIPEAEEERITRLLTTGEPKLGTE